MHYSLRLKNNMGIKGLNPFLKKKVPSVFENIYLKDLDGTYVAIDTYNWIATTYFNAKKVVVQKTNIVLEDPDMSEIKKVWFGLFLEFIREWFNHNIMPIFIFDGNAPIEKSETRKTRRSYQEKTREKKELLLHKVRNDDPLNISTMDIIELKKCLSRDWDIPLDFHENFKSILRYLQLPFIQAKFEGEQLCSMLAVEGKVSAVYSTDTDNLVYGAPLLITSFKSSEHINGVYVRKVQCVRIASILSELKYTKDKFVDLCILSGCDYNTNIPRVGIITAQKLLDQYEQINNFPSKYNTEVLLYDRCKQLFQQVPSQDLVLETNISEMKGELEDHVSLDPSSRYLHMKNIIDKYKYQDIFYYIPKLYSNIKTNVIL